MRPGQSFIRALPGRLGGTVFPGGVIVVSDGQRPVAFTLGSAAMIDDYTLRQMSREDRADLSRRLAAPDANLPSLGPGDERRRRFVLVLTVASVGLVPWIALLALTLPHRYVAHHWTLTWVGFDIALLSGPFPDRVARVAPPSGGRGLRFHDRDAAHLRRVVRRHYRLRTTRHHHRDRVGPGA